ncbi:MAG: hypothetical protein O7C59_08880 [Rickettsia endosymbiont of Ixodes persulcatus]|nr:hypothetical protein [Rickettsia endosymbiont of Ixodes persulcatus]
MDINIDMDEMKVNLPSQDVRTGQWIAKYYNFPPVCENGGGITAIISLGGGYRMSDVEYYFREMCKFKHYPKIIDVEVGQNSIPTFTGNNFDLQNTLDLEFCGSSSWNSTILFISAPRTQQGLLNAYLKCINGITIGNSKYKPTAVLCNFTIKESSLSYSYMMSINEILKRGTSMGITFISASHNIVKFPASSPYVLACDTKSIIFDRDNETTHFESSNVFSKPKYQKGIDYLDSNNKRAVPDITINDDLGYVVYMNNETIRVRGPSTASAMMCGYISIVNLYYPVSFHDALYSIYRNEYEHEQCFNVMYNIKRNKNSESGFKSIHGLNLLNALKSTINTEIPEIYGRTELSEVLSERSMPDDKYIYSDKSKVTNTKSKYSDKSGNMSSLENSEHSEYNKSVGMQSEYSDRSEYIEYDKSRNDSGNDDVDEGVKNIKEDFIVWIGDDMSVANEFTNSGTDNQYTNKIMNKIRPTHNRNHMDKKNKIHANDKIYLVLLLIKKRLKIYQTLENISRFVTNKNKSKDISNIRKYLSFCY